MALPWTHGTMAPAPYSRQTNLSQTMIKQNLRTCLCDNFSQQIWRDHDTDYVELMRPQDSLQLVQRRQS